MRVPSGEEVAGIDAESAGDRTGNDLALVVAPSSAALARCGHPGDDVETLPRRHETIGHRHGDPADGAAHPAELQPGDEFGDRVVVVDEGEAAIEDLAEQRIEVVEIVRREHHHGVDAPGTRVGTGPSTAAAGRGEDHGAQSREPV